MFLLDQHDSGKDKSYSHVLKAMNLDEKYLKGAIRISMALGQWPEKRN